MIEDTAVKLPEIAERFGKEIAGLLGCSAGTVKSQASRGLARLRGLAGISPADISPTTPSGYPEVQERHE